VVAQPRINKFVKYLLCTGLLLYGLWTVPLALFGYDWSMIPGDWGDARFNNYILEHGYRYLTGQEPAFWDAPFMYPYPNVIAFSDNLLGTMPFYAIFREIGFDRETSLQCWILVLFALNYLSAYLILQRWFGNFALSLAGAWIFAFGIFITGQVNHLQVFPRFMAAPVIYATWRYLQDGRNRHLAFLLGGLVYQFYCAVYLGFILFYCQLFLIIAMLLFHGRKKIPAKLSWKPFALVFAAGLTLLPLMWPYIRISSVTGMRTFEALQNTLPRPVSYFFTHPAAKTWKGMLSEHSQFAFDDWWSHFMFMGAMPWIGILLSLLMLFRAGKEKNTLAALLLAWLMALLFITRFGDFSLYRLIHQIPGFSSMRSIDRFINIVSLLFILPMVSGFKHWFGQFKQGRWLVYLIPVLTIIDNRIEPWELKRFYKNDTQAEIRQVREIIRKQYDGRSMAIAFMVSNVDMQLPSYHDKLIRDHLSIMLAAQELGIPLVNAYTGHYPPGYMNFFDYRDEKHLREWFTLQQSDGAEVQRIVAPLGEQNR
jgi:hypothetical protein